MLAFSHGSRLKCLAPPRGEGRCQVGGGVRGEKLQETALAPLVFLSSQWTLLFPLVVRTSVFISEAISTKAGANL